MTYVEGDSSREKGASDVSKPQHLTCRMLREQLQPQLTAWSVDTTRKVPSSGMRPTLHVDMTISGTSPLEATVLKGGLDLNSWTAVTAVWH